MNIGDYVRTKFGIGKIINKFSKDKIEIDYKNHFVYCDVNRVIKSSPNIIDLIEENDIVNHSRVVCVAISTDLNGTHKYLILENGSNCANGNIKSIVTKEQFESMEYRIGE